MNCINMQENNCQYNYKESATSPIIGILAIDIAHPLSKEFGEIYKSYIAASYVKFVESSGGRVVPIWIGKDENYYRNILNKINGILIPGGSIWFNDPENGKAAFSVQMIYKICIEMNMNGIHFPIFGICLGFELILYAASGGGANQTRVDCKPLKKSLPLIFESDFRKSKLFQHLPNELYEILQNEPVTYHLHQFCITEKILNKFNLQNDWHILASNYDDEQLKFISVIEHRNFPFYGLQFHPEKIQFEYYPNDQINHSINSIKISQFLGNFFVNECRLTNNTHNNCNATNLLIYNFHIEFTGDKLEKWRQCYLFVDDIDYPSVSLKNVTS